MENPTGDHFPEFQKYIFLVEIQLKFNLLETRGVQDFKPKKTKVTTWKTISRIGIL